MLNTNLSNKSMKVQIPLLKTNIYIYTINNNKYIVLKSSNSENNTKCILCPNFIEIEKNENMITFFNNNLTDKQKIAEFNQFINRFKFGLKNLSYIFRKKLILKGLGYKVLINDALRIIELKIGYSHLIKLELPKDIKVKLQKQYISVESKDNVLLGNFVSKMISYRQPDSYKGKGFWLKYQKITLKQMKKK